MDRFDGLSEALATALQHAPIDEKAQLELTVRHPDLSGGAARVADRLRVRILTWDPVGWTDDGEPGPFTCVEGSGSGYAITVFVGAWTLEAPIHGTVAAELTALADSIVRVGAVNEASLISGKWTELEEEGLVPPLLGALRMGVDLPRAQFELARDWWPIDVPTVAAVVGAAFGHLSLDLSPRALSAPRTGSPACPACAGTRLSVPFELDLARPAMCGPHRAEALALMAKVATQAEAENPDAWLVLCHAAGDLLPQPHVPYPIRNGLLDAEAGVVFGETDDDVLRGQALALLDYAAWAATAARHEVAMWDLGWRPVDGTLGDDHRFDDFAHQVAYRLGATGQFTLAGRVVDTVAPVIPQSSANLHGELATHLAEAGRIVEARARIQRALDDPSADLLTEIYAGEVDEAAGDVAAAEARYRAALKRARNAADALFEHEILCHLVELLQDDDSRADDVATLERQRKAAHARSSDRTSMTTTSVSVEEFGRKVGRNEPCPCGSGRKFKRCHGSSSQ